MCGHTLPITGKRAIPPHGITRTPPFPGVASRVVKGTVEMVKMAKVWEMKEIFPKTPRGKMLHGAGRQIHNMAQRGEGTIPKADKAMPILAKNGGGGPC